MIAMRDYPAMEKAITALVREHGLAAVEDALYTGDGDICAKFGFRDVQTVHCYAKRAAANLNRKKTK